MVRLRTLLRGKRSDRWKVLDQSFFSLFITFSLIELTNTGAGLIDGLIVSNFLNTDSMAAAGIVKPIFSISGIFGGMLATGMQTLCTRELGRGNVASFNRLFSTVMYLGTALSVFLTAAMFAASMPIAVFLGASGRAAGLALLSSQYIRGILIGFPALIMTGVLSSAVQMDSGRKRVMVSAVICSVLNIFLDLAAILLHMGMFGIGLATAAAQYCAAGYLFLHFLGKDRMLRFVPPATDMREMLHLLSCGTEKAVRKLANIVRPVLLNRLIIFYGGAMAMTAMSVNGSVCDFTRFFAVGLADATALLIGVLFGEMNEEGIHESVKCALRCCALFCGAICVLFLIFARPIARLYISEDGELLDMTVFTIRMIALEAPLGGILHPRIAYLQAVEHIRNMQLLSIVSKLVYVILSALALGAAFGAYGILSSFLISDCLSLLTVRWYYSIKYRKAFPKLGDYLDLPRDFSRSPGDVIELDVRDQEDVSLISEQIMLFCRGHRIDERIGFRATICFEELAANIIQHGFPRCRKRPGIDLRVVYDPGELIIRMQDNCSAFDVERQIALAISESAPEPDQKLGLRILGGMASDIRYVHSLETNNVILRFPLEPAKAGTEAPVSERRPR
ncbi:MAG: ATP-binding protein [Clostridia bacterium]|nr:ATP-binding protein [Clostridia bacterium]